MCRLAVVEIFISLYCRLLLFHASQAVGNPSHSLGHNRLPELAMADNPPCDMTAWNTLHSASQQQQQAFAQVQHQQCGLGPDLPPATEMQTSPYPSKRPRPSGYLRSSYHFSQQLTYDGRACDIQPQNHPNPLQGSSYQGNPAYNFHQGPDMQASAAGGAGMHMQADEPPRPLLQWHKAQSCPVPAFMSQDVLPQMPQPPWCQGQGALPGEGWLSRHPPALSAQAAAAVLGRGGHGAFSGAASLEDRNASYATAHSFFTPSAAEAHADAQRRLHAGAELA